MEPGRLNGCCRVICLASGAACECDPCAAVTPQPLCVLTTKEHLHPTSQELRSLIVALPSVATLVGGDFNAVPDPVKDTSDFPRLESVTCVEETTTLWALSKPTLRGLHKGYVWWKELVLLAQVADFESQILTLEHQVGGSNMDKPNRLLATA
ncbi:hypothetical protein NDU88_002948 [Pleurodeles waltl]|uniref:Endonuclease/exonuclease/phosphatase domain-containing protein n=1 Tax=Pleurodeles waltl TaxID=8319 RepID=A0AAV7WQ38_PLEWA|nr:hypothetical protein NDU88_002948 [Pleurodeles waltl]